MSQIYKAPSGFADQLPKNLISNIANFAIGIIVGIFLVPYFIDTLGIAAYGLIPLATSLVGYVAFLSDSFASAVVRFLTIDLHQNNYSRANKTFNTALIGLSIIIVFSIPIVVVISYFSPIFFNIPSGQESEVILLFLGVFFAFLVRSWSSIFTVSLFAYNRLDLQNLLSIMNTFTQISLMVILFTLFAPKLSYVGISYLFGSLVFLLGALILSRRTNPNLHVSLVDFDKSRLSEICAMGGWVIIGYVGALLFSNIDLFLVNKIFGPTMGGEYAIAMQWSGLIKAISGTLIFAITPVILTYYARSQTDSLIIVSRSSVKIMCLFLALPIGFICGFSYQLLTIWVGEEFSFLAPLMVILICHLTINIGTQPLLSVNTAFNRVKFPGILTLIIGICNFFLAIILALYTGLGYYGIAIAGAIMLTIKNAVFTPWYASRILEVPVNFFTKSMIVGLIAMIMVIVSAAAIGLFFPITNVISLIFAGVIISLIYVTVLIFFGLNRFERDLFISYLPENIRKYIQK